MMSGFELQQRQPEMPFSKDFSELFLNSSEKDWVDLQPFLLRRGYQLRPRYQPGWKPPWLQVEVQPGKMAPMPWDFEDALPLVELSLSVAYILIHKSVKTSHLMDAVRIRDGQTVVFKKVATNTDEIGIALYLSRVENRKDPRNCAVPILEVIMLPDTDEEALVVMPRYLKFHRLPFRFLGEFCEFALQVLEGLEFMHEHNIAHRDACWNNIIMDTTRLIPKGHHFCRWDSHGGLRGHKFEWNTRWSVRPVQYHLIDFGLSTRCVSKDSLVLGGLGQDKSVPELSDVHEYNPFMVDVYHIGNVLKRCTKDYEGLDPFTDLVDSMTRQSPGERPTMAESVIMCKAVIDRITKKRKLKARVWRLSSKFYMGLVGPARLAVLCGWNPVY